MKKHSLLLRVGKRSVPLWPPTRRQGTEARCLPRKFEILGTIKRGRGRPPYEPTRASRRYVCSMASVGLTQEEMSGVLEIAVETLAKHYATELATAAAAANEAVGRSLWLQAVGGPAKDWTKAIPSAGIWWTKCRMRWKEQPTEQRLSGVGGGPIVTKDVSAREFIESELARLTARARARQDGDFSTSDLLTRIDAPVGFG
jgi:hypothetical protein